MLFVCKAHIKCQGTYSCILSLFRCNFKKSLTCLASRRHLGNLTSARDTCVSKNKNVYFKSVSFVCQSVFFKSFVCKVYFAKVYFRVVSKAHFQKDVER